LNIPGIIPKMLAEGYGCTAYHAETPAELYQAIQDARRVDGPVLIEFPINPKLEKLPV
jgi:benzoylformate decarboxylase